MSQKLSKRQQQRELISSQKEAETFLDDIKQRKSNNIEISEEEQGKAVQALSFLRRTSFRWFCQYIAKDYDARIDWYPFQLSIMDEFDKTFFNPKTRIALEIPPQAAKTTITLLFIAFYYGRYKDSRIALVTFNATRAKENTTILRNIMGLAKYRELFSTRIRSTLDKEEKKEAQLNGQLKSDSAQGFKIVDSLTGEFKAVGMGSSIAGYSPQCVVIDDFFGSQSDADSLILRSQQWDYFTGVLLGREQISGTKYIIPSTRYHGDDLIGMIKKESLAWEREGLTPWKVISYPAIMEQEGSNDYDLRKNGELLIPEHKDKYIVAKLSNPRAFATVYQGNPPSSTGLLFTRDMLKFYRRKELPPLQNIVISVDTNLTESVTSDDCAITVWGRDAKKNHYLLDFWHRPMSFMQTKAFIKNTVVKKYPNFTKVLIEQKSNGYALLETLAVELGGSKVEPYFVGTKNKRVRLEEALPVFVAGQVYLPMRDENVEVEYYINQLMQFTGAKGDKDDLVDSTTQYLNTYADMYAIEYDPETILAANSPVMEEYKKTMGLKPSRSLMSGWQDPMRQLTKSKVVRRAA